MAKRLDGRLPGVAAVLGAGNHLSVVIRDILQQLVVNNNLCAVKLNPVNDFIGQDLEVILQPLLSAGAVRLLYGGADVAQARPVATFCTLAQLPCMQPLLRPRCVP
jgi:aldehyde dehydrogenase (NAD(P)+)